MANKVIEKIEHYYCECSEKCKEDIKQIYKYSCMHCNCPIEQTKRIDSRATCEIYRCLLCGNESTITIDGFNIILISMIKKLLDNREKEMKWNNEN